MQPDVIAAMRRNGRLAVPVDNLRELLGEIAAGRPVLVFQNLGLEIYPQWHFAVAIGYDLDAGELIMHTGPWDNRPVALRTFEHTWRRGGYWALVALKPGEMPVAAEEARSCARPPGWSACRAMPTPIAYEAILDRWPQSFPAWMGLGNARYALKDLAGAEAAWRGAIAADPGMRRRPGTIWLMCCRRLATTPEAVEAAKTAVELGGPDDPITRRRWTKLQICDGRHSRKFSFPFSTRQFCDNIAILTNKACALGCAAMEHRRKIMTKEMHVISACGPDCSA